MSAMPEVFSDPRSSQFLSEIEQFVPARPKDDLDSSYLHQLGCPDSLIPLVLELNTPEKTQEYLLRLKYNYEDDGVETMRSLPGVVEKGIAHCFEGGISGAI